MIFGASIAFTSCKKNSFYEDEEWAAEGTNDLITDRSDSLGTLERLAPDFSKLRALGDIIEDSISAEVYLQAIEYYGDILWNQAHFAGASSDTSSYIITVPLVKNDLVAGVILNINENGEQHVLLRDAQILDAPASELLDDYDLWQLKLLASSLSNHQYFHNGEIGFFQDKLQEIDSLSVISPRCINWEPVCHWIYFGGDINHGYYDCYYTATAGGCGGGIPGFEFTVNTGGGPPVGGNGTPPDSDNDDTDDDTAINWESPEDCELNLAPHLASQINNMSLLFPCETLNADQIIGIVMQELCENTSGNQYIDMSDVEAALSDYAYVDMSLLWSDPEQFENDYVNAACECFDSQEDCEESIIPYSCQSFEFEDLGLFQIARLRDVEMNFYNPQNNTRAECQFNVQVSAPLYIELNNGTLLTISSGIAANAAAEALNVAIAETVAFHGLSHNYSNSYCETYQNTFSTIFDGLFLAELANQVEGHYQLNSSDYEFEVEPSAHEGYQGNYPGVSETEKVGDAFRFFGLGHDCAE